MLSQKEKRVVEKLTAEAKRHAMKLLDGSQLPSENVESVGNAVAVAFERELSKVIESYWRPRR